jgi:hypothetical protein
MLDPDLFLGDPQLLEGHVELLERLGQCGIDRRWAVHPEPEPAGAVTDGMQVFEKGLVVHRRPPPHGAPSAPYPGACNATDSYGIGSAGRARQG